MPASLPGLQSPQGPQRCQTALGHLLSRYTTATLGFPAGRQGLSLPVRGPPATVKEGNVHGERGLGRAKKVQHCFLQLQSKSKMSSISQVFKDTQDSFARVGAPRAALSLSPQESWGARTKCPGRRQPEHTRQGGPTEDGGGEGWGTEGLV